MENTDFHTDLQITAMVCPVHTRSPSAYILSGRNSRGLRRGISKGENLMSDEINNPDTHRPP